MNRRLEELDSLRGLAALTVVFGHYLNAALIDHKFLIEYGPLRLLVSASEAVLLFFLLSGFVLILPFLKKETYSLYEYSNFALKRIFRIYIPYLVSIFIAILANNYFYSGDIVNFSDWLNESWKSEISTGAILSHIIFLGEYVKQFNVVTWSLVEELRISLIFPLLVFIIIKTDWKKGLLVISILYIISVVTLNMGIFPAIAKTLMYSVIFLIGALLSKYRNEIIEYLKSFSNFKRWLTLIISLILYLYAKPSFLLNQLFGLSNELRSSIDLGFTVMGAAILVMIVLSFEEMFRFLRTRIVRFFGEISYSLYLYHMIVLLTFAHILDGMIPSIFIFILSFVVTVIMSYLSYKFIELPFINLAKNIVDNRNQKKFKQSKVITINQ